MFTNQQIQSARQEIAKQINKTADEIESGNCEPTPSDPAAMVRMFRDSARRVENGEDNSFCTRQRIYYILTGISVSFL